jgi:hypothetical protein
MEPEDSLPHSQEPATSARSIQFVSRHPTSVRSVLILSFHLCVCLPSGHLFLGSPTKNLYRPLHVLPISVFLTWSPEWYLVRNTQHKAPCYVVFSTPLLPRPSSFQISSSALYSGKPSAYIPLWMWATKCHNRIKQPARLETNFECYYYSILWVVIRN